MDGKAVLALIEEILHSYGLEINPAEVDSDLLDIEANYFGNNGWFEVCEQDGRIIGSYGLYRLSNDTCELRKMYVHPASRGLGIGKSMMDRAIMKAGELLYKTIVLESNRRLDMARTLYEKYGFTEYHPPHLSQRCDFAMKKELLQPGYHA